MAFYKDFTTKFRLKLNRRYLFFNDDATYSIDERNIQILFRLKDEQTGFSELILQEFDPQGREFDQLLKGAIYPSEADRIIKVDLHDFTRVCGHCEISRVNGKPYVVTSTIEPKISVLSTVEDMYAKVATLRGGKA